MLTLHTAKLSDNLGFNGEDIVVKSVSAAWNKIREIRDTTDPNTLNDTILEVSADEGINMDRISNKILFLLNKNGKIEFKDFNKIQERRLAKKAKAEVEQAA